MCLLSYWHVLQRLQAALMLLVTRALFLLSCIKIEVTFTWTLIKVTAIKIDWLIMMGHGIFSKLEKYTSSNWQNTSFDSDLQSFVIFLNLQIFIISS